jgi:DNA-binding response OmpR family regulator
MRILVVEDDPGVAHVVKRALEHDQHVVDLAGDGDEGLLAAQSGEFDAIVLDILLPKVNGVEVCRRLRAEGVHTPVLMLTARAAVEQRVQGLDAGADDYLTKPFAVAELQARVRALGRRPRDAADEVLSAGDLTMNVQRHEVHRNDTLIELTPKEYALLEYFLRNRGYILTREQILDHVWGYDFTPATNIVDIYVHYLRNKIDRGRERKLVKTARGVGYGIRE